MTFAFKSEKFPFASLRICGLVAAIAGAVSVAGWAPAGWWPLIIVACAILYGLLTCARRVGNAALLAQIVSGLSRPVAVRNVLPGGLTIFVILAAAVAVSRIQWTEPSGPKLSYRLIQDNVSQNEKFDPRFIEHHVRRLVAEIMQAPADVIITPETAFPQFLNDLPTDILPELQNFAHQSHSNLLLGMATSASNADGYNSVIQLSPDALGGELPRYDKERLMPFGKYTPWGFGWFSRTLTIPLKDLASGPPGQTPFHVVAQAGSAENTDDPDFRSQSHPPELISISLDSLSARHFNALAIDPAVVRA